MVQTAEAKARSPGTREWGEVALEQWCWRIQSDIRVHDTREFCGQWQALQNFADGNEMRNFNYNLHTLRTSSNLCHLVKLGKLYVTWLKCLLSFSKINSQGEKRSFKKFICQPSQFQWLLNLAMAPESAIFNPLSPWWVLAFLQFLSLHFCYPNLDPIWLKPFVSVYFHFSCSMCWTHKEAEDELFIKTLYFWEHLPPI